MLLSVPLGKIAAGAVLLLAPGVALGQAAQSAALDAELVAVRDAYRTAKTEDVPKITAWCRAIVTTSSAEEKLALLAKVEEGGSRNDGRQVTLAMAQYLLLLRVDQQRAHSVCHRREDQSIRKAQP